MRIGDIIEVTFWDHAQNSKLPLLFKAWGRLIDKSKAHIAIQTWGHPENLECDSQTEGYAIVKSCIVNVTVLSPKP